MGGGGQGRQCGLEEAPFGSSVMGSQAIRLALETGLEFLARTNSWVSIIIDRFIKIRSPLYKNLGIIFCLSSLQAESEEMKSQCNSKWDLISSTGEFGQSYWHSSFLRLGLVWKSWTDSKMRSSSSGKNQAEPGASTRYSKHFPMCVFSYLSILSICISIGSLSGFL